MLRSPALRSIIKSTQRGFINSHTFSLRHYAPIFKVPEMGDSISSGRVCEILVKEGDIVQADDIVYQIETDKITADVRVPMRARITKLLGQVDETVDVGQDLFEYEETNEEPTPKKTEAPKKKAAESKPESKPEKTQQETPKSTPTPKPTPQSTPQSTAPRRVASSGEGETRVKMTKIRARIAQRLKESQNTNALLTTFNEIDMSKVMKFREENKDAFLKQHGVKLGFMGIFIKASAIALQQLPVVNAVIDGDEIVYRDYVDISVAVATPKGLVVPVIRNCERLSVAEIELEIARLAEKARRNEIEMQDMQGGTFTISNGGVYGSMMGTPIINPPQSAILGMHATKKRPVVVTDEAMGEDRIVIRPVMFTALTYDHRLVDGREGVTFLKTIGDLVQNPEKILFQ